MEGGYVRMVWREECTDEAHKAIERKENTNCFVYHAQLEFGRSSTIHKSRAIMCGTKQDHAYFVI